MDVTEAEPALTNVLTGFSTTQNYVQTLAQNMEVQATMIHTYMCIYLVGGLEHFLFFHSVGSFMIPTDEVHDFSEGSTTNQIWNPW